MKFKVLAAAVVLGASLAQPAAAQRAALPRPVSVEIVASGTVEAQPSWYTIAVTYSVSGADEATVRKARTDKQNEIRALLQKGGLSASALTLDPPAEPTTTTAVEEVLEATVAAEGKEADKQPPAAAAAPETVPTDTVNLSDGGTIKVTTLQQATWLHDALMAIDVTGADPQGELADPEGARRQAKTKALVSARSDAEAYAAALGMRGARIARISEQGNGIFFPGLQAKFQQAIAGGPAAMTKMFKNPSGVIRVDETIVVEFVLTP